jgi:predicted transcriptional regulator
MKKLTTVKIEAAEYKALKALASKRGCFVSFLFTEAIRQYLDAQSKEQAA